MEAKLHANPVRMPTVAEHPLLSQQEDLKLGYGDLPADAFSKAVGASAETIAAMTPTARTQAIGYALTKPGGMAILGAKMGRQGVVTHRAATHRLFRQSYSSRVAGDAKAALDTPISESNIFGRNQRFLADFRANHGSLKTSEFLEISSRLTGGKVNSPSQFKKLSSLKQALLTADVSKELKTKAEATTQPMTTASLAVSGAFIGSSFKPVGIPSAPRRGDTLIKAAAPAAPQTASSGDPRIDHLNHVDQAKARDDAKAGAAVKGSLFGRMLGFVKKAVVGVAAAGLLALGAIGFISNNDKAPTVDPVKPAVVQTVESGDTLWDIDQASPTTQTWQELWTMNPGISDPDLIRPGDSLVTDGPRSNPTYEVQRGDTAGELAKRFGVRLIDLQRANPQIDDINVIQYGANADMLTIPLVDVPAAPETTKHTVVSGDRAWNLAEAHGISIGELRAANPTMGTMAKIFPGDVINIPVR